MRSFLGSPSSAFPTDAQPQQFIQLGFWRAMSSCFVSICFITAALFWMCCKEGEADHYFSCQIKRVGAVGAQM